MIVLKIFLYLLGGILLLILLLCIFFGVKWKIDAFFWSIKNKKDLKRKKEEKEKYLSEHPNKYWNMEDQPMDESLAQRIYFRADMPFIPTGSQIIYFEDEYDEFFNRYIRENIDEINEYFHQLHLFSHACCEYRLLYIPLIAEKFKTSEFYEYCHPAGGDCDFEKEEITSSLLKKYIVKGPDHPLGPSLIRYFVNPVYDYLETVTIDGIKCYEFTYRPLLMPNERSVDLQFHEYFSYKGKGGVAYYIPDASDSNADKWFNEEDATLIDEIRERIEKLRHNGIDDAVIESLFRRKEKPSRLVITADYKIMLPDYKNMEITMRPLEKAVFILFIKHPEGIAFKDLSDYKDELSSIYDRISNRYQDRAIRMSIEAITDPTKNSINEKCSRIRGAFISKFDKSLADMYCITGYKGTPKKITLPRKLVTIEADI